MSNIVNPFKFTTNVRNLVSETIETLYIVYDHTWPSNPLITNRSNVLTQIRQYLQKQTL